MKLGYELTIEQTQKLVMTPELIQAIQILQFNTLELESYVEEQLLANPMLEKAEKTETGDSHDIEEIKEETSKASDGDFDWAEHFKEREYDDISYKQWQYNAEKSDYSYEQYVSSEVTLAEHLLFQLELVQIKPSCKKVAKYLIEALDENGYLTSSIKEVAELFGITEEKVLEALKIIQGFEPVGVGARNLSE